MTGGDERDNACGWEWDERHNPCGCEGGREPPSSKRPSLTCMGAELYTDLPIPSMRFEKVPLRPHHQLWFGCAGFGPPQDLPPHFGPRQDLPPHLMPVTIDRSALRRYGPLRFALPRRPPTLTMSEQELLGRRVIVRWNKAPTEGASRWVAAAGNQGAW